MVDKSGSEPVQIEHLLGIVRRLRDPDQGCPWDVGQTFQSIVPHTIEEAYELADAIESNDFDQIKRRSGVTCYFRSCFTPRWRTKSSTSILLTW